MAAIFISYSSKDSELAQQLKDWLAAEGYEQVFLDFDKHTGLRVGESWERRLYDEIDRCHAVVLILTPNWMDSKWCFAEFTQARALGKMIFPIVLSPLGERYVAPEIQGVDLKDWSEEGQEFLRRRIREITDEAARGFHWDRSRSPYPGLYSFDAQDAAIFFGRDPEVREVIEKLESRRVGGGARLLLVIGASGSGKSSLLKAGVQPRLAREPSQWIALPAFRPGPSPIMAWAKTLAEASGEPSAWRDWLSRIAAADFCSTLADISNALRQGKSRDATILISIDQFEETLTIAGPDERKAFFNLLGVATNPAYRLPFQFIGTMRSDMFKDLLSADAFTVQFSDYALRPLPLDQIERIIDGPAAVSALLLEKGLSQAIVNDLKNADALPLLAFTLRELFERFARGRRLTISDYVKLGDPAAGLSPIENAVRRKADDVLSAQSPSRDELEALKHAFIPRLIRIRDDGVLVKRPANIVDLPQQARPLLEAFVNARLMTSRVNSDQDVLIEVAHESLLHAWPLLAKWLSEERAFLIGKSQLEGFVFDWQATPDAGKKAALLQGLYLGRAMEWLRTHRISLSDQEIEFIEKSRSYSLRRIWVRIAGLLLIVGLGCAIAVPGIYAEYGRRTALECDLYAADVDNNVHVPGVEFDRIVSDAAIPACKAAVEADSSNPRLLYNLGRSYDKDGKYEDAATWYRKAAQRDWPAASNNLGVLLLYGRGVNLDFKTGVALIREAANHSNRDAMQNYTGTDFTPLFDDSPARSSILEANLLVRNLLKPGDIQGKWNPALVEALRSFKKLEQLREDGLTLRVLDRLEAVEDISRTIGK